MRELERDLPATPEAAHDATAAPTRLIVVGTGRAGGSIARAAAAAGVDVAALGRGDQPVIADPARTAVLLCVPDAAVADACARIAPQLAAETAVGHVSGATTLAALAAADERGCPVFSLHPLQTIPHPETPLTGAPCAVAGSGEVGLAVARSLAAAMGMRAFDVPEESRATYHAAAAIASNFLVALEESAADAMAAAGVANPREVLAPLVLRTAANWADAGAEALTGPIARGDEETVAVHLRALAERAPDLAPLYEALAERTRAIAARREAAE
jgi:predicted short-subunit dehydrogenase-like oxidoreductase (DUF2520 family)